MIKHFINLKDIPSKDLKKILKDAKKRKSSRKNLNTLEVDKGSPLKGKLLIQMFEKPSLRTRLSFHLAIKQLGGGTLTLRSNELHLGEGGETLEDTTKILSTYGDGFMIRTDSDKKIDNVKKNISIPIVNGLSPSSHPTQILSDIFDIFITCESTVISTLLIFNLSISIQYDQFNIIRNIFCNTFPFTFVVCVS